MKKFILNILHYKFFEKSRKKVQETRFSRLVTPEIRQLKKKE